MKKLENIHKKYQKLGRVKENLTAKENMIHQDKLTEKNLRKIIHQFLIC